ncbi:MAG: hypothetical protein AAB074_12020 [Planctomycetota bacterium]
MSLIGMFVNARQDSQLRQLSTQLEHAGGHDVKAAARAQRVAENVGELNLLMLVTMRALLDKGILTYEDLGRYFAQLDSLDGKADGKITLEDVRNALGLKAPPPAARNIRRSP